MPGIFSVRAGVSYETDGQEIEFHIPLNYMLNRVGLHAGMTWRIAGKTDLSVGYAHFIQQDVNLQLGKEKTLDELSVDQGPFVLDSLWGYYAATGYHEPVLRIISALPWSNDIRGSNKFSWSKVRAAFSDEEGKDAVRKITAGHMAKWTLAANAERDRGLIALYKMEIKYQPREVVGPLQEVIDAAENFQANQVRKKARPAIDKVKAKHPGDAEWTRSTYAGSVAIATGCIVASATGFPGLAVPCVIGGALYSGAVKLWNTAR